MPRAPYWPARAPSPIPPKAPAERCRAEEERICPAFGRCPAGDCPAPTRCPPPGRCAPPARAWPSPPPAAGICGRLTALPGTFTFARPMALAGNCAGLAGRPTGPPGGGRHVADRIDVRLTLMLL